MTPRHPARAPARAPSLAECLSTLYRLTDLPVREIARLAGITARNVYATVRRRGAPVRKLMVRRGRGSANEPASAPVRLRGSRRLDGAGVARAIEACVRARQMTDEAAA